MMLLMMISSTKCMPQSSDGSLARSNSNASFSLSQNVNTLHPNISMHILLTVLYTFLNVLKGEFVSQSRASLVGDHFLYFHINL